MEKIRYICQIGLSISIFSLVILVLRCSESAEEDRLVLNDPKTEIPEKHTPELTTIDVVNINVSSATVNAKITNTGNSSIINRGVCLNETGNPTVENDIVFNSTSVKASGEFETELSSLEDDKTFFTRAYATNSEGTAYGAELNFKTINILEPIVYLDSTSFDSQEKFEAKWNMLYPWGGDHNGSARMLEENVSLKENGVLEIKAEWTDWFWEGYSGADPNLRITFHSGAIHYKEHIKVTNELPYWEISGDFKAATVPSSWPAFWITGAWSWPPEVDILEFKGNTTNLQNTVTGPAWDQTVWTSDYTTIPNASTNWHNYKLTMKKLTDTDVTVKMYIDGELKVTVVKDYVGHPFWLIMNMQMEGASGTTNDNSVTRTTPTYFQGRNIYVAAMPSE